MLQHRSFGNYYLSLCGILTILVSTSSFADISVKHHPEVMLAELGIENEISYDDIKTFKEFLSTLDAEGYKLKLNAIKLNSYGGSAPAAMEIGKVIRDKKLNTYVAPKSVCASACIFILSSGIKRMAYGTIKVHRGTFTDDVPINQIEKRLKESDDQKNAFLISMGQSSLLLEAIQQTPFWAIRVLDAAEKRRWGVHGTERVSEEMWFRTTAIKHHITLEKLKSIFLVNFNKCEKEEMKFQNIIFDCVEKSITDPKESVSNTR